MEKDFDRWNEVKKKVSSFNREVYARDSEVWMTYFGKNLGSEQNGSGNLFLRPVLIIKKVSNNLYFVIPLSSKLKNNNSYLKFTDNQGRQASMIMCQVKVISSKRLRRKMYKLNSIEFKSIKDKVFNFFY
jgi:mRNA interferase MazF